MSNPLNPIIIPLEEATVSSANQRDLLARDSAAVANYELAPTILIDTETNLGLILSEQALYFPLDKDYHGGICSVNQPAYLMVKQNGENGAIKAATNKFIITQWQETHSERVQILETFHSSTVNWFDEKTKVYGFGGVLLAGERTVPLLDKEADEVRHTYLWGQSFRKLWEEQLRGTKLVENNEICILTLMNNVLYGYPMGLTLNTNSLNENSVQFQFQFICTRHMILGSKLDESYDPDDNKSRLNKHTNATVLERYLRARQKLEDLINSGATASAIERQEARVRGLAQDLQTGTGPERHDLNEVFQIDELPNVPR